MTDTPDIKIGYARGYIPQGESCAFLNELEEIKRIPVTHEPIIIKRFPRFSDRGYKFHLQSNK